MQKYHDEPKQYKGYLKSALGPSSPHAADNAAMTPTSSSLFFFRNGHAIPMAIAAMRCRLFRDMVCGALLLEL